MSDARACPDRGTPGGPPGAGRGSVKRPAHRAHPTRRHQGDAHVIRNAGGGVTLDVLRSLAISQRLLGTREIVLVHHTDCGMTTFTDDDLRRRIEAETGVRPLWAAEAFPDAAADVRQSLARIAADTSIPHRDAVREFVYDVATGALTEVD